MISVTDLLAAGSGSLVGFVLGLIGGGGSILAVPLLVYVVGVASPHVAIGTSAVAVALSAFVNLLPHARSGHVKWHCAMLFAAAGIVGAVIGSSFGKEFDGQRLLGLFGVLMIVVGIVTLIKRNRTSDPDVMLTWSSAPRLAPLILLYGVAVGTLAGFFGIGGGFLVVPGLMAATQMPIISAVGSSLVAVTAFGFTTATNYALSGLIDWRLASLFVAGGFIGGLFGARLAIALTGRKELLQMVFAVIIIAVGLYVVARSVPIW
ncbi:MAG: sulfite exporter TauE/SafE family protein [Hyphomicrobium sp.]|jgi:uncharacterized membrane protein YfcA